MRERPTQNPLSRFAAHEVVYDDGDGPPPSTVTLLEDHSRSILSRNDSPDLGFRWSANPYRGCLHACAYCVHPDTQVLLGDGRTRRIADLVPGDEIYGTTFDGKYRRYTRTRVLDHWSTTKLAFRVSLSDGTSVIASGDHRFLSRRGWKYVLGAEQGPDQRPHLTPNTMLMGTGAFAEGPVPDDDYRRGYLCGLLRGDATLKRYDYSGRRRARDVLHQFRLALADLEALHRAKRFLSELEVKTDEFLFQQARVGYQEMHAIRASSQRSFERVSELIAWPEAPSDAWDRGFLAGIFDSEGSRSGHVLRICNTDRRMIAETKRAMDRFGFDAVIEEKDRSPKTPIFNVRLRGGLREHLRFFHTTDPAITRKRDLEGTAIKSHAAPMSVVSIEPLGPMRLFDITTGTGDFIANGVISHNCYARPTHEYLDLGAGSDFDTKIVVKPRAAELLREAFDKPSWTGETVMFSGVTDCYQAIERDLRLTRACLEVCLEYRNPVSVISKSALLERDAELFAELERVAGIYVTVSLAWGPSKEAAELARQIEPWAAAPRRRLQVIETLAKAGVPVGVMLAPVIPGLNDDQIPSLLEAARDAGATYAGWTMLRLPGAVKQVFEERLRIARPLAADKVLHRIRGVRGGEKLSDARFHTRGSGEGVYAELIAQVFETTARRLGLWDDGETPERPSTFRRPPKQGPQLSLF